VRRWPLAIPRRSFVGPRAASRTQLASRLCGRRTIRPAVRTSPPLRSRLAKRPPSTTSPGPRTGAE
jgi:hypothetical protein